MSVYVVIAECGEYSDRDDWIAGVFTERAFAEALVLEKSAEQRLKEAEVDVWAARHKHTELLAMKEGKDRAGIDAATKAIGPCPKRLEFERLYLAEVPLDRWGKFEY